jgi:hypothetical protein
VNQGYCGLLLAGPSIKSNSTGHSAGGLPEFLAGGSAGTGEELVPVRRNRLPQTRLTKQPNLNAPATVLLQNVEVYSVVSAGSGRVATIPVPARSATVLAAVSTQNRIALTQMR